MRYITFAFPDSLKKPRLGAMLNDLVIDLLATRTWAQGARSLPAEPMPPTMLELIHLGKQAQDYLRELMDSLDGVDPLEAKGVAHSATDVVIYPPLPSPPSLRDFYAFEAHVKAGYAIRGRDVPQQWYEMPVFYYSNPNAIYGPGERIPYPSYSHALDYELEVACVIGTRGRDIPVEQAEQHIFGYMIFNDWSARDEQRKDMAVGLGPAKGKDFASSFGPAIVTPDELADSATGRPGGPKPMPSSGLRSCSPARATAAIRFSTLAA